MATVSLEGVTKKFGGAAAVEDLSLEVADGDFFSLVGPSGCGKTTTMRMIAGLEQPDAGRIVLDGNVVFDGADLSFQPAHRRGIGLVFQNYALWPHMTVKDNILFGLRVQRTPRDRQDAALASVLERLRIAGFEERYPNELSGGQQQRVALARELVTDTKVLMMDEPLSNLDAQLRLDMRAELKRLHQETGQTIIYVTHDQTEALTLSTQLAVMKDGVVQQVGSPDAVYFEPTNLFVASFIGNVRINLFEAALSAEAIRSEGFAVPRPPHVPPPTATRQVTVGLRPEETFLVREPGDWTVEAEVESIMPLGPVALVQVRLGGGPGRQMTVQHDRSWLVSPGERTLVRLPQKSLHVFDAETGARIGLAAAEQAVST